MLILDPSSNDAEQTINILRNSGHPVRASQINSEEELEKALEKQSWDLFIVRDNMEKPSAEQCLKIVRHYGYDIPFIMTTSDYTVERTINAMRLGMRDVIPEDNDEYFKLVVERELANIEDRRSRLSADNALKETSIRNELLLDSSRDAIAYITDGMHIHANHAYMELFGYDDSEDLECMPIMDLMDSKEHESFKQYLKNHAKGENTDDFSFVGLNANDSKFDAFLSLTDSKYDGEDCIQVYIKTAESSDEELEQKLKELTAQDRLTGLYNRHYLIESLEQSIIDLKSNGQLTAIFYMELDNYDEIQNEYGISECDHYLKDVSKWLKTKLSAEDILARIGDSTFAILYKIKTTNDSKDLATSLCEQFATQLFEVAEHTVTDSLSIGICFVQANPPEPEKILSNAHFAASNVQSKGGNGIRIHDDSLDSLESREDTQVAMEIQDSLDGGLIHVMYEPIVKLHGDIQKIFHARLTINSEQGESQAVEEAFKIGLKTSTALKLDNWLMNESFKTFSEYLPDHRRCKLKIHLCAASLLDDNLLTNLTELLSKYNLPVNSVIFEFSEEDSVAHLKRVIEIVKAMGQQSLMTGINGFGSTQDSESVINALLYDGFSWVSVEEKLFKNFVSDFKVQERVQELIELIHKNDLISIAPGIADAGSLATIWPMNIGHIHGEYIGDTSDSLAFDFSQIAF